VQSYFFPDNTVFINFALIDRLDLLRAFLGSRGRVTEAVEYEINRSKRHVAALGKVDVVEWFGVIIEIESDDARKAVQNLRKYSFGGTDEDELEHLGESQTIFVVTTVDEYKSSTVVTDDRAAYHLARGRGCLVKDTIGVLQHLSAIQEITPQEAFEIAVAIREAGPDGRSFVTDFSSARDF
jgi:predicted nucleic acid-binding protein